MYFNNETLFLTIVEELKVKGLWPEIIDYANAERFCVKNLTNYHFSQKLVLDRGGSEGIYLDCTLYGEFSGEQKSLRLGTIKTLEEEKDAMYVMAKLYADFYMTLQEFVNTHLNDFTHEGYSVECYLEGRKRCGYTSTTSEVTPKTSKEELLKLAAKNQYLKIMRYEHVCIRNNVSEESFWFSNEDMMLALDGRKED